MAEEAGIDSPIQDVNQSVDVMTEKMVPQSTVNHVVSEAKKKAYNQGLREAESKYNQSAGNDYQQQPSYSNATSNMGGMQQLSQADIQRLVAEETQRQMAQQANVAHANQIINSFGQKVAAATLTDPTVRNRIASLPLDKMPSLLHVADSVSNTAEVMMDLADNPIKAAALDHLYRISPDLALAEVKKLSESIVNNKVKHVTAPDPLSRVTASPTTNDSGSYSVKDLRKQKFLQA